MQQLPTCRNPLQLAAREHSGQSRELYCKWGLGGASRPAEEARTGELQQSRHARAVGQETPARGQKGSAGTSNHSSVRVRGASRRGSRIDQNPGPRMMELGLCLPLRVERQPQQKALFQEQQATTSHAARCPAKSAQPREPREHCASYNAADNDSSTANFYLCRYGSSVSLHGAW